jgi:hypothetical protein
MEPEGKKLKVFASAVNGKPVAGSIDYLAAIKVQGRGYPGLEVDH